MLCSTSRVLNRIEIGRSEDEGIRNLLHAD
jgi:hypothetical protein